MDKSCDFCGVAHSNTTQLCPRCTALMKLLGGRIGHEVLISAVWDYCPKCGNDLITYGSVRLLEDILQLQCDDCGYEHKIPFSAQNILGYIKKGLLSTLAQEEE